MPKSATDGPCGRSISSLVSKLHSDFHSGCTNLMSGQWGSVGLSMASQYTPSSPFADWETEAQEAEAGPHHPNFHEISTKI